MRRSLRQQRWCSLIQTAKRKCSSQCLLRPGPRRRRHHAAPPLLRPPPPLLLLSCLMRQRCRLVLATSGSLTTWGRKGLQVCPRLPTSAADLGSCQQEPRRQRRQLHSRMARLPPW